MILEGIAVFSIFFMYGSSITISWHLRSEVNPKSGNPLSFQCNFIFLNYFSPLKVNLMSISSRVLAHFCTIAQRSGLYLELYMIFFFCQISSFLLQRVASYSPKPLPPLPVYTERQHSPLCLAVWCD